MSPVVDQAIKDFEGKVRIVKVNTDDRNNLEFADQYQINAIPTFVFLDSKGNVIDKAVGVITKEDLYSKLKSLEGK